MMNDEAPADAGSADVRPLSRLERAALALVSVREARRDLEARRNRCACERQAPERDEPNHPGDRYHGEPTPPDGGWQSEPCWKPICEFSDDGYRGGWEPNGGCDPEDWCASCRERQRLHVEYMRLAPRIGAAYRALKLAAALAARPDGGAS